MQYYNARMADSCQKIQVTLSIHYPRAIGVFDLGEERSHRPASWCLVAESTGPYQVPAYLSVFLVDYS